MSQELKDFNNKMLKPEYRVDWTPPPGVAKYKAPSSISWLGVAIGIVMILASIPFFPLTLILTIMGLGVIAGAVSKS